jgi:hypothetical protein
MRELRRADVRAVRFGPVPALLQRPTPLRGSETPREVPHALALAGVLDEAYELEG